MVFLKNMNVKSMLLCLCVSILATSLFGCDIKKVDGNTESTKKSTPSNTYNATYDGEVTIGESDGSQYPMDDSKATANQNVVSTATSTHNYTVSPNATATVKPTANPTGNPVSSLKGSDKWIKRYESLGKDGDSVIMSIDDITQFNSELINSCESLVDILNMPEKMSKFSVKEYIESASCPNLPKYDSSGNAITESKRDNVISNRNIDSLSGEGELMLKRGIVVQRTDLRTVPTDMPFFSETNKYYDMIQETELVVGVPVWIMHESKDEKFYYVQAYNYRGWVSKNDIAVTDSISDWNEFAKPNNFVVITSRLLNVDSSKLDMGVKLPVVSILNEGFNVKLPARSSDGLLYSVTKFVSADDATLGYLPYTMNNYYKQAFKYEGAIYGWGGSYDSVDCSGFVSAVFRSFGFCLPRNVSQQRTTCGNVIDTDGKGSSYINGELSKIYVPTAVYKQKHVMLYLGEINDVHYVIHSPAGGRVVCEAVLNTNSNDIKNINTFE